MPFLDSQVGSPETVQLLGEFTTPAAQYVAGNKLCGSYQKRVLGGKKKELFEQLLKASPSCQSHLCARKDQDHGADRPKNYAEAHGRQGGDCR